MKRIIRLANDITDCVNIEGSIKIDTDDFKFLCIKNKIEDPIDVVIFKMNNYFVFTKNSTFSIKILPNYILVFDLLDIKAKTLNFI